MGNLANISATPEEIKALDSAATVIEKFFESRGIDVLTAAEFSEYDKVDKERYGFLTTVLGDIKVEKRAVPDNVNMENLAVDEAAKEMLSPREGRLDNLASLIRSARVLVFWDLWVDVGRIYRYVRYKAKEGDSWAVTLYDKWRVQYEKLSKKGNTPPNE